MSEQTGELASALEDVFGAIEAATATFKFGLKARETGVVTLGHSIARVAGLPGAQSEELIRFRDNVAGGVINAFNLTDAEQRITFRAPLSRFGTAQPLPVKGADAA